MSAAGEASRLTRLGRYELITRIGQGGMAEVQLALQRGPAGFEKLVVVKLVHNNLASQKAFVDMLLDEARVAALVKHPNVVDIYDLGQAEGRFFIAMEYLEGEPLLAVLRAGREGKRLDPLSTGRLIADTAEGLDAAHELRSMSGERLELVHHDISLGNIVVLYNGQVKLVDFGVAKASQNAGQKSKVQGKFSYMAPEKLKGASGDRRSDIFSLGCVMWEALTLKRLFRGGNDSETMKQVLELSIQPPSKVNGEVPPEYDAIVMRSLERDPDRRQATAKEMAVEIEELLRKRGYGAKNDKVAKYMQETFKSHIDARKKLVQEVVSKGSASAEVLDAAFSDQVLASGSPVTPMTGSEFSMKHHSPSPSPAPETAVPTAITNQWADASGKTTISTPPIHPMFDGGGTHTELASMGDGRTDVSRPPALGGFDRVKASVAPLIARAKDIWAEKKNRPYVFGGAGVFLLLIIVLAATCGGGKSTAKKPTNAGGTTGSAVVAVGSDTEPMVGSNDVGANAGSGVGSGSAEPDIEIDTGSATNAGSAAKAGSASNAGSAATSTNDHPNNNHTNTNNDHANEHVVRPPPPAIDVPATVNAATLAYVRGDTKGALAMLTKAKAAKPSYAPTYRVLGKVYKKLGDNAAAKKAFQKYLQLSPSATDADQIQEEMKSL